MMDNNRIKRRIVREVLIIKKVFLLLLPILLLYGCATVSDYDIQRKRIAEDFRNDKISADRYKELLNGINQDEAQHQIFSALCEQCERVFNFNKLQWDSNTQITCPYCGRTQDLKMAYNRYVYLQQQQEQERQKQQALSNQIAVNNFFHSYQQNLKQSAQRQQQYNENIGNTFSNWGGLKSTPSYQYIPSPSKTSSQQSVYWTPSSDGAILSSSEGETCIQLLNGGWRCSSK